MGSTRSKFTPRGSAVRGHVRWGSVGLRNEWLCQAPLGIDRPGLVLQSGAGEGVPQYGHVSLCLARHGRAAKCRAGSSRVRLTNEMQTMGSTTKFTMHCTAASGVAE